MKSLYAPSLRTLDQRENESARLERMQQIRMEQLAYLEASNPNTPCDRVPIAQIKVGDFIRILAAIRKNRKKQDTRFLEVLRIDRHPLGYLVTLKYSPNNREMLYYPADKVDRRK